MWVVPLPNTHGIIHAVERIMSILNPGLHCVRLARAEMSEEFEMGVEKVQNVI